MIKLTYILACLCLFAPIANCQYGSYSSYSGGQNSRFQQDSTFLGFQDPLVKLAINIPGGGIPGVDYPILSHIPDTGFQCSNYDLPGYYVDVSPLTFCQVYHNCQFDGRHHAFLCPNGTMFNQQVFVCDWWYNVDCAGQTNFYGLNAEFGKIPEPVFVAPIPEIVVPEVVFPEEFFHSLVPEAVVPQADFGIPIPDFGIPEVLINPQEVSYGTYVEGAFPVTDRPQQFIAPPIPSTVPFTN